MQIQSVCHDTLPQLISFSTLIGKRQREGDTGNRNARPKRMNKLLLLAVVSAASDFFNAYNATTGATINMPSVWRFLLAIF
jgi:hypothetical protein